MRKILIVSYCYPPLVNPRALRWSRIANYWASRDLEVHVVTSLQAGAPNYELLNGVHVHRVGSIMGSKLRKSQLSLDKKEAKFSLKKTILSVAKWIYRRTWRQLLWPDYSCLWFFPARKKALQLIGVHDINKFVSVSHPFTGHMVGLAVKNKYPDIHWLADSGDPFSFKDQVQINNRSLYQSLNEWAEAQVLRRANSLSVPTRGMIERYEDWQPGSKARTIYIPPLTDTQVKTSPPPSPSAAKLVYLGTLYPTIRNPAAVLKFFKALCKAVPDKDWTLHFYGESRECHEEFAAYENILGRKLFLHGLVPVQEAKKAEREADFLINIGNKNNYQLPSKVVEYAAATKPILNFTSIPDDSSAEMLKDYAAILNISESDILESANYKPSAEQTGFMNQPPSVDVERLRSWVKEFYVDSVGNQYLEALR